jgi:hypothetical protein
MASQEQLQSEINRYQRQLDGIATEIDSANSNADALKVKISRLNARLATVSADPVIADLGPQIRADIAQTQAQYDRIQSETIPRLQNSATDINSRIAGFKQELDSAVSGDAKKTAASSKTAGDAVAGNKTDNTGTDSSKASGTSAVSNADDAKIKSADKAPGTTSTANNRVKANADDANSKSSSPESKAATNSQPSSVTPATRAEIPQPSPNPLHKYATYTYAITLFVLSHDNYNELVNGTADSSWNPKYSLISSAGGWHQNRHKLFSEDFYFDNLKMQTIVGQSELSRGTNMIETSFTIIEPYGLTLMDRLVELSNSPDIDGTGNYVAQPYLLQIDFFGADELGAISNPIPHLRKRIPINFIEFKIKVSTRGTEYNIKAIPYNHIALLESTNSTPANFEIKAGTVGDFFSDDTGGTLTEQMAKKEVARNDAILAAGITKDDEGNSILMPGQRIGLGGNEKQLDAALKVINTPYTVDSYAGAINAWNQKLVDDGHVKVANEIEFVFVPDEDEAIRKSPIVDPTKMSYSRSNMPPPGVKANKAAAQSNDPKTSAKTPSNSFDPKTMLFNVTSGTSVVDVINLVMRNSDFIKSQVKDPLSDSAEFAQDKTVDYFRIIPKVFLKEYDPLRGEFARKTTYYIKKYTYYNTKHPNLPKARPKAAVKEYDYIFTGKNIDILDMAIDFDSAFFTTITVNRERAEALSGATGASNGENAKDTAQKPTGNKTLTPMRHAYVSSDATAQSTGADTAKTMLVASAMKSIYSGSRGDMLNIKLKIIGDPHFIKQDDIYTNPGQTGYNDLKFMLNEGTLNMDSGEIFCNINFRTPIDMDETTGLAKFNTNYEKSRFTGFYKVQVIDSEFSKGQFVQTLDLIRIFEDADEYAKNTTRAESNAAQARKDFAQSDPRLAANQTVQQQDAASDPTKPTNKTPISALAKIKEDVITRTKSAIAAVETTVNDAAASVGKAISSSMAGAKEVDISTQRAKDNSSSEPQNPQG